MSSSVFKLINIFVSVIFLLIGIYGIIQTGKIVMFAFSFTPILLVGCMLIAGIILKGFYNQKLEIILRWDNFEGKARIQLNASRLIVTIPIVIPLLLILIF